MGVWVAHDVRDQIVDFVRRWSEKTGIGAGRFILKRAVIRSLPPVGLCFR